MPPRSATGRNGAGQGAAISALRRYANVRSRHLAAIRNVGFAEMNAQFLKLDETAGGRRRSGGGQPLSEQELR